MRPPGERAQERKEAAELAEPKIYFSRSWNRFFVKSPELAVCLGHEHYNIVLAVRRLLDDCPDLAPEVAWDKYRGRAGRVHECAKLSRQGILGLMPYLRPVMACRNPRHVLYEHVKLIDAQAAEPTGKAPHPLAEALREAVLHDALADLSPLAEPAPDSAITPPLEEPFGLFDSAHACTDPAESWETNAAIVLLTKRSKLPLYLAQDLYKWNRNRCLEVTDELYRQGSTWDTLEDVWSCRPPKDRPKKPE